MIDKNKLLMYLTDLAEHYSPSGIDINGRWVGGDEKLYFFVKELIHKIEEWK